MEQKKPIFLIGDKTIIIKYDYEKFYFVNINYYL
jgi:hypothetical protein